MITRDEVCPICGELLWLEWGYWSYEECILWDFYLYPTYANRMGINHYRDVEPQPLYSSEDNYNIEEISEIEEEVRI